MLKDLQHLFYLISTYTFDINGAFIPDVQRWVVMTCMLEYLVFFFLSNDNDNDSNLGLLNEYIII